MARRVPAAEICPRTFVSLVQTSPSDTGCIQAGPLIVTKSLNGDGEASIAALTISDEKMRALEQNISLLSQPDEILDALQEA